MSHTGVEFYRYYWLQAGIMGKPGVASGNNATIPVDLGVHQPSQFWKQVAGIIETLYWLRIPLSLKVPEGIPDIPFNLVWLKKYLNHPERLEIRKFHPFFYLERLRPLVASVMELTRGFMLFFRNHDYDVWIPLTIRHVSDAKCIGDIQTSARHSGFSWKALGKHFTCKWIPLPGSEAAMDPAVVGQLKSVLSMTLGIHGEGSKSQIVSNKQRHLTAMGRTLVHELNNPIGGIYSMVQMMGEYVEPENEQVLGLLKNIEVQCKRAKEVVEYFYQVLVEDPFEPARRKLTQMKMKDLFDTVTQVIQPLPTTIQIAVDVSEGTEQVLTHKTMLLFVLINLVLNAIEAVRQTQKRDGLVTLRASNQDRVCIEVCDNGCGISEDSAWHIFTAGYSTKLKDQGATGYGLSLVKYLCDVLGYEITLRSKVGVGSIFKISGIPPC
jgi:signal transduction histidine kinase